VRISAWDAPFALRTVTFSRFSNQGTRTGTGGSGEIFDCGHLAGFTFLDPQLEDRARPQKHKRLWRSKRQANLLVDYRMPFITRVTTLSNIHYTGKRAATIPIPPGQALIEQSKSVLVTPSHGCGNHLAACCEQSGRMKGTGRRSTGQLNGPVQFTAWLGSHREVRAALEIIYDESSGAGINLDY
jgi:hypothetical protein